MFPSQDGILENILKQKLQRLNCSGDLSEMRMHGTDGTPPITSHKFSISMQGLKSSIAVRFANLLLHCSFLFIVLGVYQLSFRSAHEIDGHGVSILAA